MRGGLRKREIHTKLVKANNYFVLNPIWWDPLIFYKTKRHIGTAMAETVAY
jgi:hypothetical protein